MSAYFKVTITKIAKDCEKAQTNIYTRTSIHISKINKQGTNRMKDQQ